MKSNRSILSTAMLAVLLTGCGSDSDDSEAIPEAVEQPQGEEQQTDISTRQIDASDHDSAAYLNLTSGEVLALTEAEAASSTAWHMAFKRTNIQLNSGASGPGNVVGAVGVNQDDFYTASGEPDNNVFLNATAETELEHLQAEMEKPAAWTRDAIASSFADDWYSYDMATGNMAANDANGWLVRSAEGDSYARVRVSEFDFPTRTGEGIKSFELVFDVQPAGQATFTSSTVFTGTIPATGGESCFDFDSGSTVGCDTESWDTKLGFSGRDLYLRSNSGPSGTGDGGVFGAFAWADLSTFTSATTDASGANLSARYQADTTGGVFTDASWYAYNLQGQHQLWPNYRVYLIDTDSTDDESPVYALQVTGYYADDSTSGFPTLRWKTVDLKEPN
ncbi:HmuY family protein [Hydrocarboniclastica marina]|uniref:HmuY protein n=1 Tax=Hydrocarboniclastica marina TaxID=2259620 RepID=A0A4P7XKX2_9ALTE|nr:HmuY family protein [Hydrocarboniclastica marina]QCF27565.1 hypothetical protein soil367_17450 [Hydrocarboniclastica marina]